ncbi:MAG: glycosyltransferase, partial [Pleurocapsa sp.]
DIYGPGWGIGSSPAKQKSSEQKEEKYLGREQIKPKSSHSYLNVVCQNIRKSNLISGLIRTGQQIQYRQSTNNLSPLFIDFAKGAISFQQICSVFSSYEVVLNFSNVWADGRPGSRLIPHVRLRDFEAPMCRSCYLTGYTDEIAEFYELGKEIDTYRTQEELADKTKYYLNNPSEAEKLREAGYQRALRDHTWTARFQQLFREVELAS